MKNCAIAVFSKPPLAGQTKTRLIPALGAQKAAALHLTLLEHSLHTAKASGATVCLWVTEAIDHPIFKRLSRLHGCSLALQQGTQLGQRMQHALQQHLSQHEKALLIGSDCAVHSAAKLQQAAAALDQHDMVFTPVEDGGYVLVGARKIDPAAFNNIDWGSSQVMTQTRQNLNQTSPHSWAEMPTLWDIDRPNDVQRAQALGLI